MSNNVFYISDTHFGHAKILEYSKRPFDSIEEHDEILIQNWNAIVRPGDLIYHTGDFALCDEDRAIRIAKRLMGQKYLVYGNHDKRLRKNRDFTNLWLWTRELTQIDVGGQKVILCHFPMLTWASSHRGSWNLHGHSHGSLPDDPNSLRVDIGVDCWDYQPVAHEVLAKVMAKKTFIPIDHHGARGEEV